MSRPRLLPVLLLGSGLLGPLQAQSLRLQPQTITVHESIEQLEAGARADSNDPIAWYNLAMGYLGKERYAGADSALRRSVAIDPRLAIGWLALAVARDRDFQYWNDLKKEADSLRKEERRRRNDAYRRAFLLDPLVDMSILGATYPIPGNGSATAALRDLFEGNYAMSSVRFNEAIQSSGQDKDPAWLVQALHFFRAMASARAALYDVAIGDMQFLIKAQSPSADDSTQDLPLAVPQYRYILAFLQQRAGHADLAIPAYQEALVGDAGNFMAHVQLANIYETSRNYDAALKERQRALEVYPDDPSLMIEMGLTLGKAGRVADALQSFNDASAAGSRDVRLYLWVGMAREELGQPVEARAEYEKFLALAPPRYDRLIALAHQRLTELSQ